MKDITCKGSVAMSLNLGGEGRAKKFVDELSKKPYEADITGGRAVVDGKDLAGVSSLDLSRPITLTVHATPNECDEFIDWLGKNDMLVRKVPM